MRMDTGQETTAAQLLKESDVDTLQRILADFGEVRNALRMARVLVACALQDRLHTSWDLRGCLEREYGPLRPKVLSKVFQALRIAVNRELDELREFLDKTGRFLRKGGRLVVLSYHSLEDRMVKRFMVEQERGCVCSPGSPVCTCNVSPRFKRINRSAIKAPEAEVEQNRRARSARLRVAERV
jgi:16S rRNA (cytosine1402-N4)-methyltransferase